MPSLDGSGQMQVGRKKLWLRSSGGSSSLGVCMYVCVHKEEKQKH